MAGGNLFGSQDSRNSLSGYLENIKKEIREKGTDYVLGVDHEEWLKYFIETYTFVPLQMLEDKVTVDFKGKISQVRNRQTQPSNYVFELHVPFLGHGFLFHLRPSTHEMSSKYAQVLCVDVNGELVHTISLPNEDKERFLRDKESFIDYVRRHIPRINTDVKWYNDQIEATFRAEVRKIVEANNKTQSFLKEIGIPVNKDTLEVFQVPKHKQPEIIEPRFVKDDSATGHSQIPTVSSEFYNDVTEIINKVLKFR